jgi:VanZ family protein
MASDQIVSTGAGRDSLATPLSFVRYWGPLWLYAGLIFFGSSISNPPDVISSMLKEVSDKVLHFCEYAILGALSYRACRHAAGTWVAQYALMAAAAGCALYGLSDEIHQLFVPFREADALDLVADTAGGIVGAWSWRLLEARNAPSSISRSGA